MTSTTRSRSDHHRSVVLEAAPNGGWRILIRPESNYVDAIPYGAYSNTPDMLEGLSTLLYIEREEPPHAE
jgi:hypothetical protein